MIFLYPLLAALPLLLLLLIIMRMSKEEKKTTGLIIKLIGLSSLSMFGSMILNNLVVTKLLDPTGLPTTSLLYQVLLYFLVVPILEEGFKFLVLHLNTRRHKAFTHSYDGLIFGVSAALGFAIVENLVYMLTSGLWVGIARALFPIHFVCGIYMGHYYMLSKRFSKENSKSKSKRYLTLSLIVPMLIHGFFNFALSYQSNILLYLFVIFIIVLAVVTVKSVKKHAANNTPI